MKQNGYIKDLLDRFGLTEVNTATSPLEPGIKLEIGSDEDMERETLPYRYLSQYNTCFNSSHWTAAKRVLRYLKRTSNLGLAYEKTNKSVEGYVDADWANSLLDRKSYIGYAFILSGFPCGMGISKTEGCGSLIH